MASGNKKTYTLKINGISQALTDTSSLEANIDKIGAAVERANAASSKSNATSKTRAKALTDEEKAQKKLEDTIKRTEKVESEANKKQIEATQALREKTREITREIQFNSLAEGSIKQMGMQLTNLRNEYEGLSEAERESAEVGGALLETIQALDEKYKGLRESTGNFRDSVGNYGKATEGLDKLGESLNNINTLGNNTNDTFTMGLGVMSLFGVESDKASEAQAKFQKILALVAIAMKLNGEIGKKNNSISSATTLLQGTLTTQTQARTAAELVQGEAIAATTIKQRIFNAVASAHPLVLLLVALLSIAGGYAVYKKGADESTESSKKYASAIDGVKYASKEARDKHDELVRSIRDIQVDIDLANGAITSYIANLLKLRNRSQDAAADIRTAWSEEIDALYEDADSFGTWFSWLWLEGNAFTTWDTSFSEKYLNEVGEKAKGVNKKFGDQLKAQNEKDAKEETALNAAKNKEIVEQNEDLHDKNLGGYKATFAQIERERQRSLKQAEADNEQIAKDNLKRNKDEQVSLYDLEAINKDFDGRRREAAKSAGNEAKSAREKALKDKHDIAKNELELIRQMQDDETALVVDEFDRRRAEVKYKYERQVEDLREKLETDKTLTQAGRDAINAIILNSEKHIAQENDKIRKDELAKQEELENKRKELINKRIADNDRAMSRELQNLDVWLNKAFLEIGDVVKKKGSLEFIDVEATRANHLKVAAILDDYIVKLEEAVVKENELHAENLKNLKKGSAEYEEELARHAAVVLGLQQKIAQSKKDSADAEKAADKTRTEGLQENLAIITEQVQGAVDGLNAVFDTASMGLQMQLDALNEQLDIITEKYEETKAQREAAVENIKELEGQIQEASGGTREALKEQLQNEMHDRAELEREEARLAKEKEKREAEIAKKEKQMKRVELMSNIAVGIANTAQGVTKALGLVFPLNFIVAGLVGAMGAVQTAMMAKQLTKLEDGGLINAPRHSQGGARIAGTNIEVEGDEYVVNRESTAKNLRLIEFINDARREVTAADLSGIIPSNAPTVIIETPPSSDERVLEAISAIDFKPVVSVTDINDVNDNLAEVQDLAGFK